MFSAITLETPEDTSLADQTADYVSRNNMAVDGAALLTASSLLLPAQTSDGIAVMIKTVRPHHAELTAPLMLKLYNGHGSVRLLDQEDNIQLLERAVSNHQPLWQMAVTGRDDESAAILCEVTKKLHSVEWSQDLASSLPAYSYKCNRLVERLEQKQVPDHLLKAFETAASIQSQLAADYPHRPLHSDLHHWNIVHDDTRGWLSIDPQGRMGPAPATLANCVANPYDPAFGLKPEFVLNADRMKRQIDLISESMGWDKGDLSKFVFVHAVQVVSNRIDLTPRGQVGLDYWAEASQLADKVAGLNVGKSAVSAPTPPTA